MQRIANAPADLQRSTIFTIIKRIPSVKNKNSDPMLFQKSGKKSQPTSCGVSRCRLLIGIIGCVKNSHQKFWI
jgi:hypothetical protein